MSLFDREIPPLEGAILNCKVTEGLTATLPDGRPARLAILDADGNVIDAGEAVAQAAFNLTLQTYHNFWRGKGHVRVSSDPA